MELLTTTPGKRIPGIVMIQVAAEDIWSHMWRSSSLAWLYLPCAPVMTVALGWCARRKGAKCAVAGSL